MSPELRRSLLWWKAVLRMGIAELRSWKPPQEAPAHLFCDASSTPPYLGAVLFANGKWEYTHMAPPSAVLERFRRRGDKQIMGLELLAISLGMSTWRDTLQGRKVVIHSDNKGSEVRGFSLLSVITLRAWFVCLPVGLQQGLRQGVGPRAARPLPVAAGSDGGYGDIRQAGRHRRQYRGPAL